MSVSLYLCKEGEIYVTRADDLSPFCIVCVQ